MSAEWHGIVLVPSVGEVEFDNWSMDDTEDRLEPTAELQAKEKFAQAFKTMITEKAGFLIKLF